MHEMYHKTPLFFSTTELGTLEKIFEFLGTPTNKTWPGVEKLPLYKPSFP
jgi:hypothetical protein